MKPFPIVALLILAACGSDPVAYHHTTLERPKGKLRSTDNKQVDSLAQPLKPGRTPTPPPILAAIKPAIARWAETELDSIRALSGATYRVDDSVTAFVVKAVIAYSQQHVNCIGLYKRNGNFDFYIDGVRFGELTPPGTYVQTDLAQLTGSRQEYQVTYVSRIIYPHLGQEKTHSRISFKDTVNQLLWYKLESGRYRPYYP